MKRAAVAVLVLAGCIDWNGARAAFFGDGGSAGGGSAQGGGAAAGGGVVAGGGTAQGGGTATGGGAHDAGLEIVCEVQPQWTMVIPGHIVAIAGSDAGIVAVGSKGGQPYIVTQLPSTQLFAATEPFSGALVDVAVSDDGTTLATVGNVSLADGGFEAVLITHLVTGGAYPLTEFAFPDPGAVTLEAVGFKPGDPSQVYMAGKATDAGTMAGLTGQLGGFVTQWNLSGNSLIGVGQLAGDGCEVSDLGVTTAGGLHVLAVGRGTSCTTPAVQMISGRFVVEIDGNGLGSFTMLTTLNGPAISPWSLPGFRDRLALAGGQPWETSFYLNAGVPAIELYEPNGASHASISGPGPTYAAALFIGSAGPLIGGVVFDGGTAGTLWRASFTSASSVVLQSCTNAIITDVLELDDGGIVTAAALADGGDLTLLQQL